MLNKLHYTLLATIIFTATNGCTDSNSNDEAFFDKTPSISFTVTTSFSHDTTLFTEGLLVHNGKVFESSGAPTDRPKCNSVIGVTNLATGTFEKKAELDKSTYFGEGIAFFKNKLYQLTYKNQKGFVYDATSFKKIDSFMYSNKEGWSLTSNGNALIMSDGSNNLTFLDPENLKVLKVLQVTENGVARDSLNELEYIKGFIYANIWMNNHIVKIDTGSGKVIGKIDLTGLTNDAFRRNPNIDVLNGIAYDSTNDKIYVTGKMWSRIYQIDFSH